MYFYETTTKDACTTATERLGLFLFDDANFKVESVDSLIGSPMTELMLVSLAIWDHTMLYLPPNTSEHVNLSQ